MLNICLFNALLSEAIHVLARCFSIFKLLQATLLISRQKNNCNENIEAQIVINLIIF